MAVRRISQRGAAPVKPAQPEPAHAVSSLSTPSADNLLGTYGVNDQMISSLPPMMSGADIYARQFYRDSKIPFRRYLPLAGLK